MNLDYLVKINGIALPGVKSCSPYREDEDSDKTGRNAAGGLVRYRIARIPKVEIVIRQTTQAEMQQVLRLLAPAAFIVEWFDPETGAYRTGKFYAGDHKPEFYSTAPIRYKEMSFNLIAFDGDNGYV